MDEKPKKSAAKTARTFKTRRYPGLICRMCGKTFEGRSARNWYCGEPCKAQARYEYKSVVTDAEYRELFARQGGRCAICGTTAPGGPRSHGRPYADHCHKTGRSRGLLCHNCNRGLGLFADDPQRLLRAAAYLTDTGVRELLANAVERHCLHCDGIFRAKPSVVARGGGVYCSPECYQTAKRGRPHPRKGIPNPDRYPPREKACDRCGTVFQYRGQPKRRYCSPICASAAKIRPVASQAERTGGSDAAHSRTARSGGPGAGARQ